MKCKICDGPMPPRKTKRGKPPTVCSDKCKRERERLRKQGYRDKAKAEEEKALQSDIRALARHYLAIVRTVEWFYSLETMPTPSSYDWAARIMPHLSRSEAITYWRLFTVAATPSERARADRGVDVRMESWRLEDACLVLAARDVRASRKPFTMATPMALRIDPNFIAPTEEERRLQPFAIVPASELMSDGEDGDAAPMFGAPEGYYADDYGLYEAAPERRTAPKIRLATWEDDEAV